MSVDSRILTMKFDNAQFQQGAATTLSTLEKLKASMNFGSVGDVATKALSGIQGVLGKFNAMNPFSKTTESLTELQSNANRFSLAPIEGAVTGISKSFVAMTTIAVTALSNIASQAISTGVQMAKSLTTDPISAGLHEYETTLNSIQTIMANTGLEGDSGLKTVNDALDQLNAYSDKTIYNFAQMARNIGTFTAAGVDLDVSVQAIKGIANLAAVSGSDANQASTAMYQLSQALSTGSVKLMDWNSIVNAGMGGKVFQESLKETARNMGVNIDAIIKKNGSFRDSLQEGWLTSKVLTQTLDKFTGDLNEKQLKNMGYTDKQIEGILKMGKTAQDAATKVKTMSQLVGTLQEAAGSGWSKSFRLIFGDFNQARELFTNVNNVLGGMIGASADARNKVIGDWNKLGGRTVLIDAISNAWDALMKILKPIKAAFRDIFPAKTGADLYDMTIAFRNFTEGLIIGKDTMHDLRSTFAGVFAIFHIVGQVIGAVAHEIGRLFGLVGDNAGDFLNFTGGIGDAIVAFDKFLEKSGVLETFFGNIGDKVQFLLGLLIRLKNFVINMFAGFGTDAVDQAGESFDKFGEKISPLESAAERIKAVFKKVGGFLSSIGTTIGNAISHLGDLIAGAINPDVFESGLKVINTALLGGIVYMVRNFFKKGFNVGVNDGGLIASIKSTLGALTNTLKTMQASVKADILLKIAAALAILTASIVVLSMIKPLDLIKALYAMAVGLGALVATLLALNATLGVIGSVKVMGIAAALVILASAMILLALALKIFTSMDLGDMLRGLTGMVLVLKILVKALTAMSKDVANIFRIAAALLVLGLALNVIALAMKIFATMDWEELAKGFVGVGGSLAAIGLAMKLMPKSMVLQAAGLVLIGIALNAIAASMKIFSTMDWEDIAKGLVGVAGALLIIAGAMQLMPISMPVTAAGLILVGIALSSIAGVMKIIATMDWEDIAKALVGIAGALLILAGGLYLMSGTLSGAAALVVAAGALTILTPVLITLGSLDWETIIKGLVALAGIFTVLGLAGLILAPLVPVLIGLGIALTLVGAGLALAGVGALAFATAFGIIVATGVAGIQVLYELLITIVEAIPEMMKALGLGVVAFVVAIASGGPKFVKAMSDIIGQMLDAVTNNIPKLGEAFMALLTTALKVISQMQPKIVDAGLDMIVGFLAAVRDHIGPIVGIVGDIVINFINALGKKLPEVIGAGINFVIEFLNGMADAIDEHSYELGQAGANLGIAIVEGIISGLAGLAQALKDKLVNVVKDAYHAAYDYIVPGSPSHLFRDNIGKPIAQGIAAGIDEDAHMSVDSVNKLGKATLESLKTTMKNVSDGFKMEADMNPIIAPVLDLTDMRQEARKMGKILEANPLSAGVSYGNASEIALAARLAQEAEFNSAPNGANSEIKFEQHNHSPRALSAVEIYRSTRNQLAFAKEVLAL